MEEQLTNKQKAFKNLLLTLKEEHAPKFEDWMLALKKAEKEKDDALNFVLRERANELSVTPYETDIRKLFSINKSVQVEELSAGYTPNNGLGIKVELIAPPYLNSGKIDNRILSELDELMLANSDVQKQTEYRLTQDEFEKGLNEGRIPMERTIITAVESIPPYKRLPGFEIIVDSNERIVEAGVERLEGHFQLEFDDAFKLSQGGVILREYNFSKRLNEIFGFDPNKFFVDIRPYGDELNRGENQVERAVRMLNVKRSNYISSGLQTELSKDETKRLIDSKILLKPENIRKKKGFSNSESQEILKEFNESLGVLSQDNPVEVYLESRNTPFADLPRYGHIEICNFTTKNNAEFYANQNRCDIVGWYTDRKDVTEWVGRNGKYRLGDKEKVDMFIDLLGSKVSQLQTKVLQSYGIEPNEEIYQQQSTRD